MTLNSDIWVFATFFKEREEAKKAYRTAWKIVAEEQPAAMVFLTDWEAVHYVVVVAQELVTKANFRLLEELSSGMILAPDELVADLTRRYLHRRDSHSRRIVVGRNYSIEYFVN